VDGLVRSRTAYARTAYGDLRILKARAAWTGYAARAIIAPTAYSISIAQSVLIAHFS
jgi:hypothetical protein